MNDRILSHSDTIPLDAPLPLPRFVQIEPVGQCNLRCQMCPIAYRPDGLPGSPPAFIEVNTFRQLVDSFPGLEELHLQGLGEPLMHPHFFAMVRYATERGIRVSTNTNLTLLTSVRVKPCVDSGLDTLHASIDGATAATYESIRLRANFSKVLRNLDRLVACREDLRSATPQVRIVAVAMRRNLDELPDIVRLAHEHGVDTVFVQHLCHDYSEGTLPEAYRSMRDFVTAETLLGMPPERVEAVFGEARRTAKALGIDLRLPPLAEPPKRRNNPRGCDWPHHGAYLSYRGESMPCCMVSTPDRIKLGNMAEQGVAAVWNNLPYRAFRAALASDDPPEVCRGCSIYNGTF
jgi:MoaA/NifB/PqqE/SkfB family radical SAM enzyme